MAILRRSYDPPPAPSSPMPVMFVATDGQPSPQAADGSPAVRTVIANRCLNFNLRAMSFYTSKMGSLHNVCPISDADIGDMVMTLYKKVDELWVLATDSDATKTVIEWEAHYNFEIIGGRLDVPPDVRGGTTDAWFVSVIGVPDYPTQLGGSIRYLTEVNLEAVTDPNVDMNGRATSYLAWNYEGAPNTNKLRFIFKHPAGAQKRFQLLMDHFV